MNKQALMERLVIERDTLNAVLESLTPEQMTAAPADGWSVKDNLAHLAVWTARMITLLFSAERGQKPPDIDGMLETDRAEVDAQNAQDYAAQKDRPLDRVLSDFHGAHRQLLKRLATWNEADLFDTRKFSWARGHSVADLVLSEVADHDADHRAQIGRVMGNGKLVIGD